MGLLEEAQVADRLWRDRVDRTLEEHKERLNEHDALLDLGAKRMTELTTKIDTNTTITESIKADTAAVVKAFQAWGGFTTVGRWIIATIVGAAALIVAGGVIYWFISSGTLPRSGQASAPVAQAPK